MKTIKGWLLVLAEGFDAWRVVPRLMLISYGYLVWALFTWYKSIPQYLQTKCDGAILQILLDHGQTLSVARELACNIMGTTGGPTSEQTMFVTTIIGLSTGIFALYTTTGRQWQREKSNSSENQGNESIGDASRDDMDEDRRHRNQRYRNKH